MRRAENLLTSLEWVLSARVVTTPLGEVSEVHILAQGRIVESGGPELAAQLEVDGYAAFAGDVNDSDADSSADALSDLFSL